MATGPLRKLLYAIKRTLHGNHALYRFLYLLVTFNIDNLRQLLDRKQYPSKFGGQWTDRNDFEIILKRKMEKGLVDAETEDRLRSWRREGYLVLEQAIAPDLIDALVRELDRLPTTHPPGLMVTGPLFEGAVPYRPDFVKAHESIRIVDQYFLSEAARKILLGDTLMNFIKVIFERRPILTQSLGFEYGSEQEIHQDTAFVIMTSPLKMVGIWIALEDVQPGSGELIYYPGSHLWPDFLFSGKFRHYDKERDGREQLDAWFAWLHEEARRRNVQLKSFLPKKGDALLWHAGLAHGGSHITRPGSTRRSLVGHYCPVGTRPLYHYYKPGQRKVYETEGYLYTTSYYR